MPHPEPLVSRLRYASQVIRTTNTFPIPAPPGEYRSFRAIQAYSDEPYVQKYGKFLETRFHELEHESKMRLLKTHTHTSGRRGYEADKERQEKRERELKKTPPYHLKVGAGRECVDGKAGNRSSATTLARGGEAKLYHRLKENKKSHSSPVPQSRVAKIPRLPPAPIGGGERHDEKENNTQK